MFASRGSSAFRRAAVGVLVLATALTAIGCTTPPRSTGTTTAQPTRVILASTTSTKDSGLLDELVPAFQKAYPAYKLEVVAVGSGEALKLGETKDADVLLVHSKDAELKFVESGFGIARKQVMFNDFIVVGPKGDPAGVTGSKDTTEAFTRIAKAGEAGKAVFYARADKSGTSTKELKIWAAAGIVPTQTPNADAWYQETGSGMGDTLKIASEKGGYTLADRGTYLSMKDGLDLVILFEKDKGLANQYGVIVVKGAKNQAGGQAFADWILTPEVQKAIGEFGVAKYGEPLFTPNATTDTTTTP
jgi:tungstate transport system substrate-binding protein